MFIKYLIQRGFKKRGPWITKFSINGVDYGGDFDPNTDIRITWFKQHFPDVETILDLGSLEGAQSFILSESPKVKRVVGLESREVNIEKANYVKKIIKNKKVVFHQIDVNDSDLTEFGAFDIIFCAGILYHLETPWDLIRKMSKVTDQAFIWTHYAKPESPRTVINGYKGMIYNELGLEDPQSGMSSTSFWLEFDDLIKMIKDNGFPNVKVIEKNPEPSIGPVTTLIVSKNP